MLRLPSFAAACSVAGFAAASPPDQAAAPIADRLFEEARVAIESGRNREACEKFAESHRLDATLGTLLNLAVCHELEGRVATAVSEYERVIAQAKRAEEPARAELAEQRLAGLRPRVSSLTLIVDRRQERSGLRVLLDGMPIGAAAWGTALPLDPGRHQLHVTAPGRVPWGRSVEVGTNGDHSVVQVPPLSRVPEPPVAERLSEQGSPDRSLGIAVLAVGLAAAGVGTYFGVRARDAWSDRNRHCPDGRCDSAAVEFWRDAKRYAVFADAAFALSMLGAGAGIYLLVVPGTGDPSRGARTSAQGGIRCRF
jgi:hypothetical protein